MKNLIVAFLFGFLAHFFIDKYFIESKKEHDLDYKNNEIKGFSNPNLAENEFEKKLNKTHLSSDKNLKIKSSNNSDVDLSNCPTPLNTQISNEVVPALSRTNNKNSIVLQKISAHISDRKLVNMDFDDLKQMSDTVLPDPGLTLVRSKQVIKYRELKKINGIYEGYLYLIGSGSEIKSINASMEIEFSSNPNNDAIGKYKLEFGDSISSGEGTPNGFKINTIDSAFLIHVGPDKFLQIISFDPELKANYYKNNELAGFAKLKRIR